MIGEPVSAAAGVQVPSKIYWQMLREICDKHGVLLICRRSDQRLRPHRHDVRAVEQYGIQCRTL